MNTLGSDMQVAKPLGVVVAAGASKTFVQVVLNDFRTIATS